jgi:hypothetical protein
VDTVRRNLRTGRSKTVDTDYGSAKGLTPSRFPTRCVVLDEELEAAENSMRSPTSCLATVLTWSTTDEEYTETDPARQITVWNHSETTNYEIDTFGTAEFIDGHWWFFGDCAAMSEREPEDDP